MGYAVTSSSEEWKPFADRPQEHCGCEVVPMVLNRAQRRKSGLKKADKTKAYVRILHKDDCPYNLTKGQGLPGYYAPDKLKGKGWR